MSVKFQFELPLDAVNAILTSLDQTITNAQNATLEIRKQITAQTAPPVAEVEQPPQAKSAVALVVDNTAPVQEG